MPRTCTSAALDSDRLESCLGRLGERERMVVLLTFYAERSARHVADELTMTEGNVRVFRHRAIGKLRTCMTVSGTVRLYSLSPGERVPCAAFPGDDLMVLALRADLSGSESVTLSSMTDVEDAVVGQAADAPVGRDDGEILWAVPADAVRRIPSSRLRLKLSSSAPDTTVLAEYELEHTSLG